MAKGNLPKGLPGLSGSDSLRGLGGSWFDASHSGGFGNGQGPLAGLAQDVHALLHPGAPADSSETTTTLAAAKVSGDLTAGGPGLGGPIVASFATPLTNGPDNYVGGAGVDSVDALDGNDIVQGVGGNDTLYGASGLDSLYGGAGDDVIFTGVGDDVAFGGSGSDLIFDGGPALQISTADDQINAANSGIDAQPFVTPLSDGSGGYIVGWSQGFGLSQTPDTTVFQRYTAAGVPIGGQVRFDQQPGVNTGFRDRGEVQLTALKGAHAGEFVVVWFSYHANPQPGDEHSAFMAHFGSSGAQIGNAVQLSPSASNTQSRPTVVALDDGTFVATWQDQIRDTNNGVLNWGIYSQHYQLVGTQMQTLGNDFHVSQTIGGNQALPQSIVLSNGNILVSWNSDSNVGDAGLGVYFRILNPAGGVSGVTNETRAAVTTTGDQFMPGHGITALTGGGFVVVWTGNGPGDANGAFFRRFDNSGTALDLVDRPLNTTATGTAENFAVVTALPDGGFFAVWETNTGATTDLVGQRFNAAGTAVGSPITINSLTAGAQNEPNLTTLPSGTIVVTWDGAGTSGADRDVFQRLLKFGSSGGHDTLTGGSGLDALIGESGNDTLQGGAAADSLFGGSGQDWGDYTNSSALVKVDLTLASQSSGEAQGDVLAGIEHLFGSAFADTLAGDANVNSLLGNDGNDTLVGRGGGDFLDGGNGVDMADYRLSAAGVNVTLGDAFTETGGDAQGDTLTRIEVILGSSLADSFSSVLGAATFFGNSGKDSLAGAAAAESFDGGSGGDIVSYAASAGAVNVDLTTGLGSGGLAAGDWYTQVETVIGGSGADTLRGTNLAGVANLLIGGSGADLLRFSLGADTLIGGSGLDTASYDGASVGVLIDLAAQTQSFVGLVDPNDTLVTIENAIGTSFNDAIRGTAGVNTLVGGDGNDTLEGRAGADTLVGGTGLDWADYISSSAAVTVTLGSSTAQTGAGGGDQVGDTLVGIEAVRGSDVNDSGDTLSSLLGAAILDGAAGNDLLIGGAGTDSYIGGAGSDTVDYRASLAGVTVNFVTGLGSGGLAAGDIYTTVENVLGSALADTLIGSLGTNTLAGFDGNDFLSGGSGADSLLGGAADDLVMGGSGADFLDGGAGLNDIASYTLSTAGVQVDLVSASPATGGDAQGDVLTGIEHLVGSNFNDVLTGGPGVNWLFGQSGSDRLDGGKGADSLFGGSGNDVVIYDALDAAIMGGLGMDTLVGGIGNDAIQMNQAPFHFAGGFASFETIQLGSGNDYFLGSSVSSDFLSYGAGGVAVFGGSGADYIAARGNGAIVGNDDSLYGGNGNDVIWGGGGSDVVSGDSGNDAIYGGFGNDKISGGSGYDVVYFGRDEGNDSIKDAEGLVIFWGNDALEVTPTYDGVDPSEVLITYGLTDVTITFTDGSSGSITFGKGAVQTLNLFDYANGDAGNSATPPPQYVRDVWSAEWDSGSQTFTAFTKVVDG